MITITPPQISPALESKLVEFNSRMGGVQYVFKFDNYGASVVCHDGSYGGKENLWELAVLNAEGEITYDTPITSDVIGWLEWEKVLDILFDISKLQSQTT